MFSGNHAISHLAHLLESISHLMAGNHAEEYGALPKSKNNEEMQGGSGSFGQAKFLERCRRGSLHPSISLVLEVSLIIRLEEQPT